MDYRPISTRRIADEEYDKALRRAVWLGLIRKLGRRCNDLIPVSELLEQVEIVGQRDLGRQRVPITRIIGSDRTMDFNLFFYPKRRDDSSRWQNIAQARLDRHPLPPPSLLKIEEAFLVVDGNHRISVSRAFGENQIEAKVMDIAVAGIEYRSGCVRLGFRPKKMTGC